MGVLPIALESIQAGNAEPLRMLFCQSLSPNGVGFFGDWRPRVAVSQRVSILPIVPIFHWLIPTLHFFKLVVASVDYEVLA